MAFAEVPMRCLLVGLLSAIPLLSLAAAGAQPPAVPVEALGWLAGSWAGESDGVAMEEHWLPAKGGLMLGMHRDVANGKAVFFEYLRIELTDGVLTYWASPKGAPPTPFRLAELGKQRVVFTNPQNDFPQRIAYWLDADRNLHARVEGVEGGHPSAAEWVWKAMPGH
jgi:hypothetical protein